MRPKTAVAPTRPGLTHQEWVKQKDAVIRLKNKLKKQCKDELLEEKRQERLHLQEKLDRKIRSSCKSSKGYRLESGMKPCTEAVHIEEQELV